jgi:23S rRNA pseudouridine1911/1915/1917 synthase
MSDQSELIFIEEGEESLRLDQILAKRFQGHYSRTYFQQLIEQKLVLVNGEPVKKRIMPKLGDEVEIEFIIMRDIDLQPENIALNVLFEDSDILVINKPAGLVVHPAPGNWTGTFVNALLHHCQGLEYVGGDLRPGIVHRLDKETSGVLIAAKNRQAQSALIQAFSAREVDKRYRAITVGSPGERLVSEPIGRHPVHRQKMAIVSSGRQAISSIKTVRQSKELAEVEIGLLTGRTHQIRVHLDFLKTPVLGDPLYGNLAANKRYNAKRQLLHAEQLSLKHPRTGQPLEFKAALPDDFQLFLENFF